MKQLTIWLLQTGEPLPIDSGNPRPMRAINLANALNAAGHRVVLWSSVFYHQEKSHRTEYLERTQVSPLLEIRLIPSPGYKRNIGLGRLWDHLVLAHNLKKILKKENSPPDVAFIGYPPIETASVMGRWLSKRNTPHLLDVKDLWPLVFLDVMPAAFRPLGRFLLAPYFSLAKACLQRASGVSAMAESFLDRALTFGKRKKSSADGVFPLTSPVDSLNISELDAAREWWAGLGIGNDQKFRICYVGNLSSNVDLRPIKEAAIFFMEKKLPIEFIICGNGVSLDSFKEIMQGLPNVLFPGRIERSKFLVLSKYCQACLIPYINNENFQLSLPNKTFDALSLGLPILSPLRGEVAKLIINNSVGLSYDAENERSLIQCIELLIENPTLQQQMSKNALDLYEKKFSFAHVYGKLVKHLEMLTTLR
jgi:glycosyltransferase involved in cell wall biosynthesis